MKNLVNYFKKPLVAIAFSSTLIMVLLKLLSIISVTWKIVFIPLIMLSSIYVLISVLVLVAASCIALNKKIKNNKDVK